MGASRESEAGDVCHFASHTHMLEMLYPIGDMIRTKYVKVFDKIPRSQQRINIDEKLTTNYFINLTQES